MIVNADDFGASASINAAVLAAHRAGSLRSASLMITGEAAAEAVEIARANPDLAVGLHLVLVSGRAASPPTAIPRIVDASGRFPESPVQVGLAYGLSAAARRQAHREVAAQFERFAATGIPLSHVDGHHHMHLHPALLPRVTELAARYGAVAVRIPRDDVGLALRCAPSRAPATIAWALVFGILNRWSVRTVRSRGFPPVDHVYGLYLSGGLRLDYVLGSVAGLSGETAELYCHPDTSPRATPQGPNRGDLALLLHPALPIALASVGGPATFSELRRGAR